VVGIGLLALVTTACGSPEIQPLIFGPAPWQAGEVSTFAVTDINGAYAGTARYDWSRLGDDLWGLRREISAQGTQEIIATDLREPGFRPVQSTLVRMDPSGTEQVRTSFDGSEANLELTTKQSVTTFERVSIPSDVRTQSSLVMILRALPLADNYATRLNIFNPILGQFERVTLTVEEREEVTTPAGSFSTWRVHLASPTSETDVWVAVDAPYPVIKYTESRNGGLFELSEFVPGS
jgi:hypothetical protein